MLRILLSFKSDQNNGQIAQRKETFWLCITLELWSYGSRSQNLRERGVLRGDGARKWRLGRESKRGGELSNFRALEALAMSCLRERELREEGCRIGNSYHLRTLNPVRSLYTSANLKVVRLLQDWAGLVRIETQKLFYHRGFWLDRYWSGITCGALEFQLKSQIESLWSGFHLTVWIRFLIFSIQRLSSIPSSPNLTKLDLDSFFNLTRISNGHLIFI